MQSAMGDLPPEDQMHVPVPNISIENLMGMIEKMKQLSDEERAEIMQNLRRRKAELEGKVLPEENETFVTYELLILLILVAMIVYIIGTRITINVQ